VSGSEFHSNGLATEKPEDQTCRDGVVEPSTGECYLIESTDGLKRQMYACSSLSGTEKPCSADTGKL